MAFSLITFCLVFELRGANRWPTSAPSWPHYPLRKLQVLDGVWSFGRLPRHVDPLTVTAAEVATPDTATVPSNFDMAPPGVAGFRGTVAYRTHVSIPRGMPALIEFRACAWFCRVFADGLELTQNGGHRIGGYTPFWLELPSANGGPGAEKEVELVVVANNDLNSTISPMYSGWKNRIDAPGDFWHFAGLHRSVIMHSLACTAKGAVYAKRLEIFTRDAVNGLVDVNIVLAAVDEGPLPDSVSVALKWDDGETLPSLAASVNATTGFASLIGLKVPAAQQWSPSSPALHVLTAFVGGVRKDEILDAVSVRFGLRTLGIDPTTGRLALNGGILKLHGWNRHTMWPDTGSAVTPEQHATDVRLLKEAGANYVRGAHYPQDQVFLDLCDEAGILVWEEAQPDPNEDQLQDSVWRALFLAQLDDMVIASINHPSVIFHGFFNEGPTKNADICTAYAEAAARIRLRVGGFVPTAANGGQGTASRLVTWADNKRINSACLAHADVISFNDYPGWYSNEGDLDAPAHLWSRYAADVRKHYPLKPFTISETGGGGIFEWRNSTLSLDGVGVQWSQLYQAQLDEADVKVALSNENISGISLWQFADSKANENSDCLPCTYESHPASLATPWNCSFVDITCHRAGGKNNKGAVDYWRRKKLAYSAVQRQYWNESSVSELGECRAQLQKQDSIAECIFGQTFGCNGSLVMWANAGCRGMFRCNNEDVVCESRCDPPHAACLNPNKTYCACVSGIGASAHQVSEQFVI